MNNNQLLFKFSQNNPLIIKENLIIGDFNKDIVNFLFNNNTWPLNILYIHGNPKVGKSFVSKLFLQNNQGKELSLKDLHYIEKLNEIIDLYKVLLLEDLPNNLTNNEENLFYLYNLVVTNNIKLIITSKYSLGELNIKLQDLKSRLFNTIVFKINEPNELSSKTLLFKMFQDRQLKVNMKIINYILNRVERKAEVYFNLVMQIEQVVANTQKNISLKLVKSIL